MRILMIGYGFIGAHLRKRLVLEGHEVAVFSRRQLPDMANTQVFQGSFLDEPRLASVLQRFQPEVVYHLASEKVRSQSVESIGPALTANLMGTYGLLKTCAHLKSIQSIIVMGTAEEYGNNPITPFQEVLRERPITAYSLSKTCQTQLCEMMHRTFDLPITVLRPSLVYGPGQSDDMFLPALIRTLLSDRPFEMTAGEQERDFIYVDDVVDAMLKVPYKTQAIGEVLNIASGRSILLKELATLIADKLDKNRYLQLDRVAYRKNEIFKYSLNIEKAMTLLGWSPMTRLEQGLDSTLTYYRERPL